MKIAWCHAGDAGGSKRAAFEMVRELARRGHVIDEFIIRSSTPYLGHFPLAPFVRRSTCTVTGVIANRFRPYVLSVWATLLWSLWQTRRLKQTFRDLAEGMHREGYEIVHIDQMALGLAAGLLPWLRVPSIVYCHEASRARYGAREDNSTGREGESWIRRGYTGFCGVAIQLSEAWWERQDIGNTRHAQMVLTNSHYSKEMFFERYGRLARVCPYGVDVETFRPLGVVDREPMVLSVGRLVQAKQHHVVVEAVGTMVGASRPRVVIATPEPEGRQEEPTYAAWVRRVARERGVELEIRHNPPQEVLVRLYNQALVLVFLPLMEPFGLVALEAMACGTPVIGVREGGIRESVLEGETGFLVERDPHEIAATIEYVQSNGEVRARLGAAAAEHVRAEWTWGGTIDRYEVRARELLGR